MYTGRLVSIRYRDIVIQLRGNEKKRKRDHPEGVQMGFDTGSDLTYLTRKTFDAFVTIVSFNFAPFVHEVYTCINVVN